MTDPAPNTACAVVGGGPAGMVLGLLLARAGVAVTVFEKHGDFLRDFRGDTVHPSTMTLLDELGLGERFAALPRSEVRRGEYRWAGRTMTIVDFGRLRRQRHPYVAMVPQWDLLRLLADVAAAEPGFTLRMRTEVTGLLRDGDRIVGVAYRGPDGSGELPAELTVACDGRRSGVRRQVGLSVREYPVNFDVWWFRLPRPADATPDLSPRVGVGKACFPIPRSEYFQIAYLIPKGDDARLRARGLAVFHADVAELMPECADAVNTVRSWDDVKKLDVRVDRARRWHAPGLLCIGDAAHAMSPVGGVGINLAVQDAVAAAARLAAPLSNGALGERDLAAVQRRRTPPTAVTQLLQRGLHTLLGPILLGEAINPPAAVFTAMNRLPWLSALPAYLIGVGIRPEHAPAFARRGG